MTTDHKGRTVITYDMLHSAGACAPALIEFTGRFPNGATWDELIAALSDRPDWAAWVGRRCPACVAEATWEARLALQRDNCDRAYLGWRCPAGVVGATWEARMAPQRDDCDRHILGCYCPAGVPGATWEARLALQRDDCERAFFFQCCPDGVEGDPR